LNYGTIPKLVPAKRFQLKLIKKKNKTKKGSW